MGDNMWELNDGGAQHDKVLFCNFELWTLKFYSSSTSYVEYQAGGGKGLVDLVNQLTLERY